MSKDAAIAAMQRAIIQYIEARIPKNNNQAQVGTVVGGKVRLTDGRTLRSEPTINIHYGDGSKVVCIIPDGSNIAAVTGVLV